MARKTGAPPTHSSLLPGAAVQVPPTPYQPRPLHDTSKNSSNSDLYAPSSIDRARSTHKCRNGTCHMCDDHVMCHVQLPNTRLHMLAYKNLDNLTVSERLREARAAQGSPLLWLTC